jgi:deazaflavin-dependent oxidoreductase (nitroreductase family)
MNDNFTGNSVWRFFVRIFAWLYKTTNGQIGGRVAGLNVLLLTTTGRKSGKQHTAPLGYFEHDGAYVIIASNGGADTHPDWFLNLRKHPKVAIRIRDKDLQAGAELVSAELRKELWGRLVRMSPQYGGYATNTKREIPLVLLRPL